MQFDPDEWVQLFVDAGASSLTIHVEAVDDPRPVLEKIRERGAAAQAKAGDIVFVSAAAGAVGSAVGCIVSMPDAVRNIARPRFGVGQIASGVDGRNRDRGIPE